MEWPPRWSPLMAVLSPICDTNFFSLWHRLRRCSVRYRSALYCVLCNGAVRGAVQVRTELILYPLSATIFDGNAIYRAKPPLFSRRQLTGSTMLALLIRFRGPKFYHCNVQDHKFGAVCSLQVRNERNRSFFLLFSGQV